MAQNPAEQAANLIKRLRERGHAAAADHLASRLTDHNVERTLLLALREACETVLTAIESIDPVTQTMIEELRLAIESRLRLRPRQGRP